MDQCILYKLIKRYRIQCICKQPVVYVLNDIVALQYICIVYFFKYCLVGYTYNEHGSECKYREINLDIKIISDKIIITPYRNEYIIK